MPPFSSRLSVGAAPRCAIGIVDPAGVPKPTVTSRTPASRARRAASATSSGDSHPSPSLKITSAVPAPELAAVRSSVP